MSGFIEPHPNAAYHKNNDGLGEAEQRLPQQMGEYIGRYPEPLAVLGADYLMLLADALYRVENAYPDARRRKVSKLPNMSGPTISATSIEMIRAKIRYFHDFSRILMRNSFLKYTLVCVIKSDSFNRKTSSEQTYIY